MAGPSRLRRDAAPRPAEAPDWAAAYAGLPLDPIAAAPGPALFRSFFQGGFECSSHVRSVDRARVDMIAATRHDAEAADDYRQLAGHGIRTVRDGLRWHLIGRDAGRYDWASLDPMLAAARDTGTEVIWDLLHYGWPDRLDIWDAGFAEAFAAFAAAAAVRIGAQAGGRRFYAPVNEISFFAWGGGDVGYLNPFLRGHGEALKRQLGRTAAAAMAAIRAVDSEARFVHPDPVIRVATRPDAAAPVRRLAERYTLAQFEGWDMIAGRRWPELGGRADYLDIVGVNYYPRNQWLHEGGTLPAGDPLHKPFRYLLLDAYLRYRRPIFVAETGTEGPERPAWFVHVCDEVRAAMRIGVPVAGICLYPVLNHPGWDDARNCPNGLLEFTPEPAPRAVYRPLADELARQRGLFAAEFGVA